MWYTEVYVPSYERICASIQSIFAGDMWTMAKKGELSKTARASLAQRDDVNFMTGRVCEKCGEPIMYKELQPVKVFGQGMQYYHKSHYTVA